MRRYYAGGQQQMERFGYTNMTSGQQIPKKEINNISMLNANGDKSNLLDKFSPNSRNLTSFGVGAGFGLLIAYNMKSDCKMCYVGYALSIGLSAYILSSLIQNKILFREV